MEEELKPQVRPIESEEFKRPMEITRKANDPSPFTQFCFDLSPIQESPISVGTPSTRSSLRIQSQLDFSQAVCKLKPIKCKCVRSKCVRSLCECYAKGVYCNGCDCVSCKNQPKIEPKKPVKDKLSCKCKKTECLKNYCDCFHNRVRCTDQCHCTHCKNTESTFPYQLFR